MSEAVRRPAVAGAFYPGDPSGLRRAVEQYLGSSGESSDPAVTGIVTPHAGYVYSGPVAGAAFASAPEEVDRVLVLAAPHRFPVAGASVYDGGGIQTPLGVARVDRELVERLMGRGIGFEPTAHASEHSAEVQLPFVQVRWPEAEVCVVLQGTTGEGFSGRLAEILADLFPPGEGRLLVVSTDLSHYHSLEQAEVLDGAVMEAFETGEPERLSGVLSTGRGEACGGGPLLTSMYYGSSAGCGFRKVAWDTSATASGDRSAVVGYMAGVITLPGGSE